LTTFSKRLRERRLELGLEQTDLARAAGVAANSVSHYETGSNEPKISVLLKFAKKLRCSADWLLGAEPPPAAPAEKVPAWVLPLAPYLERVKSKGDRNSVKLLIRTLGRAPGQEKQP
jgi:transcriptional regulator with XRE-family HTH domain